MEVICLESEAFYRLIKEVVGRIQAENPGAVPKEPRWIQGDEAMRLLGITSRTTLQNYRNEAKIRFSKQGKKIILYDRESILKFIENKAQEMF